MTGPAGSQLDPPAPAPAPESPPLPRWGFDEHASAVLTQLRAAMAGLLTAIPGNDIRRPADLQKALGVHYKLAWQTHRLATAANPLAEAANVPGPAAMKRFLKAAATKGVPEIHICAARNALDEFGRLVKTHAGDRTAFDSMVTGLADDRTDQADLPYKRSAFRAYSHLWGVQARTQLSFFAYQPSDDDPESLDLLGIRGLIDLRRLRRDATCTVSHTRMAHDSDAGPALIREPIDPPPHDDPGCPSLLADFCTQPLPAFRITRTGTGFLNVELDGGGVGSTSAVTCLLGDVFRQAFSRYAEESERVNRAHSLVRTPCEVLIQDVLLHEEIDCRVQHLAKVFGDHRYVDPSPVGRECDLLSMHESVEYLGRGLSALHTPDVPRYVEMVKHAMTRLGWNGERFHVHRCRVSYPVMPSSIVSQFELADRPGA